MQNSFLDNIAPIDRVTFTRFEKLIYRLRSIFGFKNSYTWRQIILMKDKDR